MFNKISKLILVALSVLLIAITLYNAPSQREYMLDTYQSGINSMKNEEYQKAQEIFSGLGDYKDSIEQSKKAQTLAQQKEIYDNAMELTISEDYQNALKLFTQIKEFKDSEDHIEKLNKLIDQKNDNEALYNEAHNYYKSNDYILAIQKFTELKDYKNSEKLLQKCRIELAKLQQSTTISAGIRSSVGINRHGKVYITSNDHYSWKSELDNWTDIISISVKGNFVAGLKSDGTVITAGTITYDGSTPEYYVGIKDWSDIISVSLGQQYIIGLKSDGKLVAQGHNGNGQANIDEWHDIIACSTGWRHTVGLDSNGEIYITGFGSETQLNKINEHKDDWINIIAISAGGGNSNAPGNNPYTAALKQNGKVITTLPNYIQEKIDKWNNIIAISAGDFHLVGLKSDGTVVIEAIEYSEDLHDSIKKIKSWTDIVAISAGYGFTLGLKSDGTVIATGYDYEGQINVDSWRHITKYEEEWESIFDKNLIWKGIK